MEDRKTGLMEQIKRCMVWQNQVSLANIRRRNAQCMADGKFKV
jgi:hypothetical protein